MLKNKKKKKKTQKNKKTKTKTKTKMTRQQFQRFVYCDQNVYIITINKFSIKFRS